MRVFECLKTVVCVIAYKMYQLYVATGALFLITGLLTATYIFYATKINCAHRKNLLFAVNALATITTGVFYIYCSILLAETDLHTSMQLTPLSVPEDTILNTTNNQIPLDLFELNNQETTTTTTTTVTTEAGGNDDFLKNYQQLLNNVLKHNIQGQNRKMRSSDLHANQDCRQKIFLQHAMMISAFIESVLFILNNCKECKNCDNNNDDDDEIKEKNGVWKKTQKNSSCYTTGYLLLLLMVPTICLAGLYYVLLENDANGAEEIQNFFNTTTSQQIHSNDSEITAVVKNIYKIINTTSVNKKPPLPVLINIQEDSNCHYTSSAFKIYVFLLIILGYITTVFYMMHVNNTEISKWMYLFATTWLPGVVELFARVFLTGDMPSTLSDLFATMGSVNILLMNVRNAITARKDSKNVIRPAST